MPIKNILITKGIDIIQKEVNLICSVVQFYLPIFCSVFNIDQIKAIDYIDELFSDPLVKNYFVVRMTGKFNEECFCKLITHENYVAAPGTILNSVFLYVLIRNFNLKNIFEAGTASGFYTSFLLLGAKKTGGHVDTVDLLDKGVGESIIIDDPIHLSVYKNTDSLSFLREKNLKKIYYDLYCHDSMHTFSHMLKELHEFKKCEKEHFFIFFDDQRTEDFWNRAIQTRLFDKKNYCIRCTNEPEQLGGFLQYKHNFGDNE